MPKKVVTVLRLKPGSTSANTAVAQGFKLTSNVNTRSGVGTYVKVSDPNNATNPYDMSALLNALQSDPEVVMKQPMVAEVNNETELDGIMAQLGAMGLGGRRRKHTKRHTKRRRHTRKH